VRAARDFWVFMLQAAVCCRVCIAEPCYCVGARTADCVLCCALFGARAQFCCFAAGGWVFPPNRSFNQSLTCSSRWQLLLSCFARQPGGDERGLPTWAREGCTGCREGPAGSCIGLRKGQELEWGCLLSSIAAGCSKLTLKKIISHNSLLPGLSWPWQPQPAPRRIVYRICSLSAPLPALLAAPRLGDSQTLYQGLALDLEFSFARLPASNRFAA
jgi:hypothetical protein